MNSRPEAEPLCRTIRKLALDAGSEIMKVRAGGSLSKWRKADSSPVTEADLAADRLIFEGLTRRYPGSAVVSEEKVATQAMNHRRFFIVDPLDGTRSFISGAGDFTVNIAYVEDGVPVHGVVYAPVSGRLFATRPDGSAVEERRSGARAGRGSRDRRARRLRVSCPDNQGLVVAASRSHSNAATEDYIARYRVREIVSAGSSLKFCLVAAGEADIYPRLGPTMEWDTAAGQAVLTAAGGRVAELDGETTLTYGKPGYRNPFFVAHSPGVELK